jgi:ribonuclease-3
VFLDGGLAAAEPVVKALFAPRVAALPDPATLKDAKTRLQEYLQERGLALPRYRVVRVEGAAHAQTFRVSCEVAAFGRRVQGGGSSRRRAEQEAAERMLGEIDQGQVPEQRA